MNLIGKARQLETIIARTFNGAAQRVAQPRLLEPLEVLHAILEAVEAEVQPAGRGVYVFPFNRLKVSIVAPSREARARYEAVFDGAPALNDRILQRLRSVGCDLVDLSTKIGYVSEGAEGWSHPQFQIEFARGAHSAPVPVPTPLPRRLELAVLCGATDLSTYSFRQPRIDLGRCTEVRDSAHRLIRTNHVAFVDGDTGVNASVSRCHAHVEYDGQSDHYRIYDDRSAHGTGVLRNGRALAVAPGARGVRLQSGDEIALGEARLRVTVGGRENP